MALRLETERLVQRPVDAGDEGAQALLRHGFTVLDVRSVFATTMAVNTPSRG